MLGGLLVLAGAQMAYGYYQSRQQQKQARRDAARQREEAERQRRLERQRLVNERVQARRRVARFEIPRDTESANMASSLTQSRPQITRTSDMTGLRIVNR